MQDFTNLSFLRQIQERLNAGGCKTKAEGMGRGGRKVQQLECE